MISAKEENKGETRNRECHGWQYGWEAGGLHHGVEWSGKASLEEKLPFE